MNDQFIKFKKKIWRDVIVKCALSATAAALLSVNAVLLPCLLCGVMLFWAWYLLIGLGGFILGGGIAFLFFRTNDKKIAARLDRELHLNERVQTALRYQNQEGDMLDLQRDDTILALKKVSGLAFCNLALTIVLAASIALNLCALPLISVFAGGEAAPGTQEPYDPPREVTDWEWQALDELIDYVKASEKADSRTKDGIVSELEGLRRVLLTGVSEGSLPVFVQNTVTGVRNVVSESNEDASVTEEQKARNSEEGDYVVNRLYLIFSLQQPNEDPGNNGNEKPGGDTPETPGNNTGTGELIIEGVVFYDPEKKYISNGDPEVRDKYYSAIQQAMLDGTISRAEWENIVATYFADLRKEVEE